MLRAMLFGAAIGLVFSTAYRAMSIAEFVLLLVAYFVLLNIILCQHFHGA